METINGNSVNNFTCNTCNKIYKNKSGIWKHNKSHHTNVTTQKSSILLKKSSMFKTPW